jgi:hypothetical protein
LTTSFTPAWQFRGGAFTYFLTKALFDAGHRKKRFKFQELTKHVADRIAVYYQQTPQLVGPKTLRRAFIPWHASRSSVLVRGKNGRGKK